MHPDPVWGDHIHVTGYWYHPEESIADYGSQEKLFYQADLPFSFLSVSMPACQFAEMIGNYLPDPDKIMELLPGKRFEISEAIQKSIYNIGPLEIIHSGFEMMQLEGRLLENLSLCLQAALCEPDKKRQMHQDDLKMIRAVGKRIEEEPATIPDIATLAGEYCMSVSKLTRCFRQVYGVSLHAYVIGARLQKGAELLLNHGITVPGIKKINTAPVTPIAFRIIPSIR